MNPESGAGRSTSALLIRERIRAQTLAALHDVGALHDRYARAVLLELVGETLGRPADVREQATAQLQLLELFRFCTRHQDGLSVLARQLPTVEPGCSQAPFVQRLADEWTAVDALDGLADLIDSWEYLANTLGGLAMPYGKRTALVRSATHARVAAPPSHAENCWHDFLHLAGQGAPRGGLPPWMVYLERSTDDMGNSVALEMLARNRQWALSCDLAELLDHDRRRPPAATAPVRPYQEYLAIHIAPDPLESGHYTVSHSFMSDARGPHWEHGETYPRVPAKGLQRVVTAIIRTVEGVGGDRLAHVWLEFVLPFELLNLPVDWWPRDTAEVPNVPLAVNYPVVIRSLDRLQNRAWHRFWRARWQQLGRDEHPSKSVYINVARRGGDHLRGLEARLGDNEHFVALVLSEPPLPDQGHGRRELQAALRSGLPVVIWHRSGHSPQEFREVLDGLLDEGLQRLPAKVAAYRRRAAIDEDSAHPGRHLTVLWDDPDRKPVLPDAP
ncbi:VMAP-C domain-containing protein [Streptomyces sp. NBC_00453]|uniref:VMAP-C domain-containing protein n=1 Tax=Streptomyces sp. NBC_00453 TaxID=2903653 RepID=UPI002E1EB512